MMWKGVVYNGEDLSDYLEVSDDGKIRNAISGTELSLFENKGVRMEAKTKFSSPWMLYYRRVEQLFAEDPHVEVTFNNDTYELKLVVSGQRKAKAIAQILPKSRKFGNIEVHTRVLCEEDKDSDSERVLRDAFEDNDAVSRIESFTLCGDQINYVVFEPWVVQYFSDNIGGIDGVTSTIYEEIAKDLFGETVKGTFFCTERME